MRETYVKNKKTQNFILKKHDAKAIFKTLNIQTVKLPPFVLNIWGDLWPYLKNNFFSVRLLSVLRGHSVFFHPRHNGQWPPTFIHYIYVPILILEKELAYFPF